MKALLRYLLYVSMNIATLLLLQKMAFAQGSVVGGGGNVVVCFKSQKDYNAAIAFSNSMDPLKRDKDNEVIPKALTKGGHITSIEILELYNLRRIKNTNRKSVVIIPVNSGEGPTDYARRIISRIKYEYPNLYQSLMLSLEDVLNPNYLSPQDDIIERIPDANEVIIPSDKNHCMIVTALMQQNYPELTKLTIDTRLFNHEKHSPLSQGVSFLHESIYRWARFHGHKDSALAQILTQELISKYTTYEMIEQTARSIIRDGTLYSNLKINAEQEVERQTKLKRGYALRISLSPEYQTGIHSPYHQNVEIDFAPTATESVNIPNEDDFIQQYFQNGFVEGLTKPEVLLYHDLLSVMENIKTEDPQLLRQLRTLKSDHGFEFPYNASSACNPNNLNYYSDLRANELLRRFDYPARLRSTYNYLLTVLPCTFENQRYSALPQEDNKTSEYQPKFFENIKADSAAYLEKLNKIIPKMLNYYQIAFESQRTQLQNKNISQNRICQYLNSVSQIWFGKADSCSMAQEAVDFPRY